MLARRLLPRHMGSTPLHIEDQGLLQETCLGEAPVAAQFNAILAGRTSPPALAKCTVKSGADIGAAPASFATDLVAMPWDSTCCCDDAWPGCCDGKQRCGRSSDGTTCGHSDRSAAVASGHGFRHALPAAGRPCRLQSLAAMFCVDSASSEAPLNGSVQFCLHTRADVRATSQKNLSQQGAPLDWRGQSEKDAPDTLLPEGMSRQPHQRDLCGVLYFSFPII